MTVGRAGEFVPGPRDAIWLSEERGISSVLEAEYDSGWEFVFNSYKDLAVAAWFNEGGPTLATIVADSVVSGCPKGEILAVWGARWSRGVTSEGIVVSCDASVIPSVPDVIGSLFVAMPRTQSTNVRENKKSKTHSGRRA